jgi:hypothetical protein
VAFENFKNGGNPERPAYKPIKELRGDIPAIQVHTFTALPQLSGAPHRSAFFPGTSFPYGWGTACVIDYSTITRSHY